VGSAQMSTDDLASIGQVVRRVARARGADSHTADDIAQETLTRLLAAGDRLEPEARLPWAITTAGNLLVNLHREADRTRRHRHRLLDLSAAPRPENELIAREEATAVRSALDELDDAERQLLVDHLEGASTSELAGDAQSSPGAVAARLNRTRARMRLDYLLALRRVELPTASCRRVLLAVSAADQRRQHALGASVHLGQCPTCADLVAPLAERKSRLAGIAFAPLIAMGAWGGHVARAAQRGAVQATAGATAVAVTAGTLVLTGGSSQNAAKPAPRPVARVTVAAQPAALRTAAGTDLLALQPSQLQGLSGQQVIGEAIATQSVVSYPGFWVGTARHRVYVHLVNPGLVRNAVRAGEKLSFTGVIVRNPMGFAAADGVSVPEGSGLLDQQGVHIDVDVTRLHRD
jgi:RNA polymerase sigma factor (sigma-70 family)